jgi:hypothetical protein
MIRMILAAAAAFALVSATPALACPNCHDCPMHKDKVAAAGEPEKKDGDKAEKKATCACAAAGQECKCGDQCQCPHCAAKHAEKKDAKKT